MRGNIKNSSSVAVAGVGSALAFIAIIASVYLPLAFTGLIVAAACYYLVMKKSGIVAGILSMIATSILALMIAFDIFIVLNVVLFCPYALVAFLSRGLNRSGSRSFKKDEVNDEEPKEPLDDIENDFGLVHESDNRAQKHHKADKIKVIIRVLIILAFSIIEFNLIIYIMEIFFGDIFTQNIFYEYLMQDYYFMVGAITFGIIMVIVDLCFMHCVNRFADVIGAGD